MHINTNLNSIKINLSNNNIKSPVNITNKLIDKLVNGQILDIRSNEITLEILDGQIITGSFINNNQINIGDMIQFIPTFDDNNNLFIKIPFDESSGNQNISNLLGEYSLAQNDENINIVKSLIQNNMTVTKDNILKFNQGLKIIGNDNKEEILFLLKNHIPINKVSANLIKDFANNEVNITSKLNDLFELINNLDDKVVKNEIFSNLNKHIESNNKDVFVLEDSNYSPIIKIEIENTNLEDMKNIISNLDINYTEEDLKEASKILLTSKEFIKNNPNATFKEVIDNLENNFTKKLVSIFEKTIIDKKNSSQSENNINNNLDSTKDIFKQSFSFDIKKGNLDNIDDILNNILKNLETIKTDVSKENINNKDILKSLDDIKESVKFFNNYNDVVFFQLPINNNNNIKNSELFVFKDKNSKKKSNKNISTALVSLDTVNFGKLESYIQKNNKSVNIQFRIKNVSVEKIVKDNIINLSNMLEDVNYILSNYSFIQVNEIFNIVKNDLNNEQKKELSNNNNLSNITFDIRT